MVCGAQRRLCQWTPLGSGSARADAIVAIDDRISARIAPLNGSDETEQGCGASLHITYR